MTEDSEEMEDRLRLMAGGHEDWDLSPNDMAAIGYALRAIEERQELLAALRDIVDSLDALNWPRLKIPGLGQQAHALIARLDGAAPPPAEPTP